jgi:hypothetical protein
MDLDTVLDATLGPAIERLRRTYASDEDYLEVFKNHPALAETSRRPQPPVQDQTGATVMDQLFGRKSDLRECPWSSASAVKQPSPVTQPKPAIRIEGDKR